MKTKGENDCSRSLRCALDVIIAATALLFCLLPTSSSASGLSPSTNEIIYTPLIYFSFSSTNDWTSDTGYLPISFTNLSSSYLGDGPALVVDSTNPAWLQFPIVESGGTTNLSVNIGSVMFWYAPAWSSTNQGGAGPGETASLLNLGGYTTNSSFGLWCLYVDSVGQNICFSAQTNDNSGNFCTYVTTPISFSTNFWHFIAFVYSTTNTALYLDGVLATNGPPLTNYPGPLALANGMFIGSSSNGEFQANGMIDDLYTYNTALDAKTVELFYFIHFMDYYGNPLNQANFKSAGSDPSTSDFEPDAISGAGYLQLDTNTFPCVFATNANIVWITNVSAVAAGGGTINVTFTIDGGQPNVAYDVFATGGVDAPIFDADWAWMGQGAASNTYTLPISGSDNAFLILGTPVDSYGADLTDAYQWLILHNNPANTNSADGILMGWEVLLGLNPQNSNLTDPTKRSNYGYTPADWLSGVSGARSGSITNDPEGNVLQVSQ